MFFPPVVRTNEGLPSSIITTIKIQKKSRSNKIIIINMTLYIIDTTTAAILLSIIIKFVAINTIHTLDSFTLEILLAAKQSIDDYDDDDDEYDDDDDDEYDDDDDDDNDDDDDDDEYKNDLVI